MKLEFLIYKSAEKYFLYIVIGELSFAKETGSLPDRDIFVNAFFAEHMVAGFEYYALVPHFAVGALDHVLELRNLLLASGVASRLWLSLRKHLFSGFCWPLGGCRLLFSLLSGN